MRNFFEAGIRTFRPAATPNKRKKIDMKHENNRK
jgi:hypothetical protein